MSEQDMYLGLACVVFMCTGCAIAVGIYDK